MKCSSAGRQLVIAFSNLPPAPAPTLAPAAARTAPPKRPIAVIGPTPGTRAATINGPPESPAAPPTRAPMALAMHGCSAATTGTDRRSVAVDPGLKRVTRSSGRPSDRILSRATCASVPERNTPVTDLIVETLLLWKTHSARLWVAYFLMPSREGCCREKCARQPWGMLSPTKLAGGRTWQRPGVQARNPEVENTAKPRARPWKARCAEESMAP